MNAISELISKELFTIKQFSGDQEELFSYVANQLLDRNFVTSTYLEAIIERESKFPTGLKTALYDVAIPHTDPDYVLNPFVFILKTNSNTKFLQMGSVISEDQSVYPKFIFFLGFNKGEIQLEILQELMTLFNDTERMKRLENSTNFEEIKLILKELV